LSTIRSKPTVRALQSIGALCYNQTVTYRCETDNIINRQIERETSSCAGALPCSGGDCDFGETESNTRFIEAAVQANILQQADGDRFCEDETDPSTCKIFTGEAEYCSWEVTGLGMDCCEAPGGMDILSYVMTANLMLKTNKMAADGLFGETAEGAADGIIDLTDGAYTTIKDGVTSGWNTISEPITSTYNSLIGNATNTVVDAAGQTVAETAAGAGEGVISNALASLQQEAFNLVYDMLPEELAGLLFKDAAGEAASEATTELFLNEAVASALQSIMAAYSIYSTIKLALTLLTMCDENESDMGIKLGQRQCFKVDGDYCSSKLLGICYQKRQDYCCYNSILARIVMEQAGPLLGKDLTTCEGLSQAELSTLDFNRIDLSEWVGLMIDSGSIKDEAGEQNLTGAGQLVGSRCETFEVEDPDTGVITVEERCFKELEGGRELNTYGRQNVSDRTSERMDGSLEYSEDIRGSARGVANNLDCSASPRPPVCDFGFDIRNNGGG
jgi:conjugal transfer mating pair stabilization protein TraN